MGAYRLNGRVFWPLLAGGCTALLGLWARGGPARGGALFLLLLLLLGLVLVLGAGLGRGSPAEERGEVPSGRRRAALEAFYAGRLRPSPHVLGHSKAHVGLVLGELVRLGGRGSGPGPGLALRGDFVPVGSAYEQHKVGRPDAFEVLLPLRLPPGAALRLQPAGGLGWSLELSGGGLSGALRAEESGQRRVSSALVLRWLQGHVRRCLGAVRSRLQGRLRLGLAAGPGRPLALLVEPRSDYVCCHLSLAVRLIPALPWGEALFLTPLPAGPPRLAALWTLNVAKPEQRLLAWLRERGPADSCHLKCLQLLKGLRDLGGRALEQPLAAHWGRVLSSALLKTALLALLLRGPPQAWADRFLVERLDDLVAALEEALRRRHLPHLFLGNAALPEAISLPKLLKEAPPVNLLADFDGHVLDQVAAHLRNTWRQAPQIIHMYGGHRYSRTHTL